MKYWVILYILKISKQNTIIYFATFTFLFATKIIRIEKTAIEYFIASRDGDFYEEGINSFSRRWKNVVKANGVYFDS